MRFLTQKELENTQETFLQEYYSKLNRVFESEKEKVLLWFKGKYPKRTVKWRAGNGTCFWEIDGKTIPWDDPRQSKVLRPLFDFEKAYCEMDYSVQIGPYC